MVSFETVLVAFIRLKCGPMYSVGLLRRGLLQQASSLYVYSVCVFCILYTAHQLRVLKANLSSSNSEHGTCLEARTTNASMTQHFFLNRYIYSGKSP